MAGEKPADYAGHGAPDDWPESPQPAPSEDLFLELDGPDVRPESVDSIRLLAFASSYLSLLERMGAEEGIAVSFRGLEIKDKCVAVKVRPDNSERAKMLADESSLYLLGAKAPTGLAASVSAVRESVRALPAHYQAKVIIGPWERDLIVPGADSVQSLPASVETVRATVLRVGGADPKVRFRGYLDRDSFSVDLTRDQAKQMASYLYRDVDIEIRVLRTVDGRKIYCELVSFVPLSDQDPTQALDSWFRPHAEFWDKVADVSEALGRRDRS